MSILAIGSIAYDTIKSPFASGKNILGGSLIYFSLTASYFSKVGIVGIVGNDFKKHDLTKLKKRNIDTSGLKIASGKTLRWSGVYSYDLNSRETLFTHLNVFKNFNPVIPAAFNNLKYVFLGNTDPDLQIKVLKQVHQSKLVVCDTMNYWIERKRQALLHTLRQIDVLIINESEARLLAKEYSLVKAARKIISQLESTKKSGPATLLIKQGGYGCLMFQRRHWFSLPAFPLEKVYDPTGAGDAFAGGFVGFLATQKQIKDQTLKKAAVYGTVMASFAVEKLGPSNLVSLSQPQIHARASKLIKITKI